MISERVAVVTGASGAIGAAIAEGLARLPGFSVVLVCRDEGRAKRALTKIERTVPGSRVSYELADLSRKMEIERLASRLGGPLHVLVNNAAIAPRRKELTKEGIELQFACNVLGYFWLTLALEDRLAASAPSRVVNVASYWAGDLALADLEFERRPYDNDAACRQSKQWGAGGAAGGDGGATTLREPSGGGQPPSATDRHSRSVEPGRQNR